MHIHPPFGWYTIEPVSENLVSARLTGLAMLSFFWERLTGHDV
jgi:hypothetical protein